MLGVGLISGTLKPAQSQPVGAATGAKRGCVFEREIESVSRSFDGGKDVRAARTALFLKGKVLGSTLLTLAYDADKPSDTTLFRDIRPISSIRVLWRLVSARVRRPAHRASCT